MTVTNVYGTAVTQWFMDAQQATSAGGPVVNLAGGTVKVGDGNGTVPTFSQILANGGVLHQVWTGPVNSIVVDAVNSAQIDVGILIPTVDASGAEIGPFNVTEFAIYEAGGNLCVYGTTNLQKTISTNGQLMTLAWNACYVESASNAVTVQPPSGSYPTLGALQAAIAGLLSVVAPLTLVKTLQSSGWTTWLLGINKASQPADATSASDVGAMGVGRPATAAEFASGVPVAGNYAWPWPTLQQVAAALASLRTWVTGLLNGYLPLTGGIMTGFITLNAAPTAALHPATKGYVDGLHTPLTTIVATPQPFGGWSLVQMDTITPVETSDVVATASEIIIQTAGKYLVTVSSQIDVTVIAACTYYAALAIYLNDNAASNLLHQMIVGNANMYMPGAEGTNGHEIQMSQMRQFNAGDTLTGWLSVYSTGSALYELATTGAAITLTRLP